MKKKQKKQGQVFPCHIELKVPKGFKNDPSMNPKFTLWARNPLPCHLPKIIPSRDKITGM